MLSFHAPACRTSSGRHNNDGSIFSSFVSELSNGLSIEAISALSVMIKSWILCMLSLPIMRQTVYPMPDHSSFFAYTAAYDGKINRRP